MLQGIHPSIRGEVWEFLLGCYDTKSTFNEREQIRQRRRYTAALCSSFSCTSPTIHKIHLVLAALSGLV